MFRDLCSASKCPVDFYIPYWYLPRSVGLLYELRKCVICVNWNLFCKELKPLLFCVENRYQDLESFWKSLTSLCIILCLTDSSQRRTLLGVRLLFVKWAHNPSPLDCLSILFSELLPWLPKFPSFWLVISWYRSPRLSSNSFEVIIGAESKYKKFTTRLGSHKHGQASQLVLSALTCSDL